MFICWWECPCVGRLMLQEEDNFSKREITKNAGEWWDSSLILMGVPLASDFTLISDGATICFIVTGERGDGRFRNADDANMCAPAAVIIACEGILTYQKLKYIKTISKK